MCKISVEDGRAIHSLCGSDQRSHDSICLPERLPSERYIALIIFFFSFLYLCAFRRATWIDLDEGIILQGAQRILDGQVLYRDFFSFFTPGSYYLLALMFRLFGNSYLVAHTALAFTGAAFSPVTYLLARRVCSRQTSLLVTGLMAITALPLRFVVMHNWDSTFYACLSLYCAVRLLESPSTRWAFAAATCTSLTALFEQSKGAGLLLGLGAGFLMITMISDQSTLFTRGRLIAIAVGLALPFLLAAVYFASRHAFSTMLASWFWPLQHYSGANRVPYAYDNMAGEGRRELFNSGSTGLRLFAMLVYSSLSWVPLLPIIACALLVRLVFRQWRPIPVGPEWAHYVLVSSTITGLLLSVIAGRADYFHFIYLQPIFFLALAWLLGGRNIRNPFFTRIAPAVGFCAAMSLLTLAAELFFATRAGNSVVTRRGTISTGGQDTVIEYVQAHVAPREKILIYPYQSTYYYLTQTSNSTSFDFYQPGMHTDQQLREMMEEFTAHPTRVVLYQPDFADRIHKAWPNTSPAAYASDPMAEYITREYRECITLSSPTEWHFLFMVRKNLSCPNEERPSS
jgi:4-amino-4-deoxy-L-arabinose transferase-like glycosyltransferase